MAKTDELPSPEADIAESTTPESDSHAAIGLRRRVLRRPTRHALKPAAIAALLAASLAGTALMGWQLHQQRAVDDAARQALAAAQHYAVVLTSVDSTHLDQNFTAVMNGATGEFKDMYTQSSSQLKQVLIDSKAKADGKVLAAGVKSATTDKVEVMIFLDQAVTNSLNPEPRLDRNRIILTMQRLGGRWLASKVDLP